MRNEDLERLRVPLGEEENLDPAFARALEVEVLRSRPKMYPGEVESYCDPAMRANSLRKSLISTILRISAAVIASAILGP